GAGIALCPPWRRQPKALTRLSHRLIGGNEFHQELASDPQGRTDHRERACAGGRPSKTLNEDSLMLFTAKKIEGFSLLAADGEIGKVKDLYFDDHQWRVRYVVVDTGGWLSGRRVLISPVSVGTPDWEEKTLPVNLTREQVESSPGAE